MALRDYGELLTESQVLEREIGAAGEERVERGQAVAESLPHQMTTTWLRAAVELATAAAEAVLGCSLN